MIRCEDETRAPALRKNPRRTGRPQLGSVREIKSAGHLPGKRKGLAMTPALKQVLKLEGEVDAEFTPDGARDEGSVGSKESGRVTQR